MAVGMRVHDGECVRRDATFVKGRQLPVVRGPLDESHAVICIANGESRAFVDGLTVTRRLQQCPRTLNEVTVATDRHSKKECGVQHANKVLPPAATTVETRGALDATSAISATQTTANRRMTTSDWRRNAGGVAPA